MPLPFIRKMKMISLERLKELIIYEPDTGNCFWKSHVYLIRVGTKLGFKNDEGYLCVLLDRKRYRLHRVIWFYMTGEWPKNQIDHRNNIPDDNRWFNLREATNEENCRNKAKYSTNTSGHKGVYWNKTVRKWYAYIGINNKLKYLGLFVTKEEAIEVYAEAAKRYHGEFAKT